MAENCQCFAANTESETVRFNSKGNRNRSSPIECLGFVDFFLKGYLLWGVHISHKTDIEYARKLIGLSEKGMNIGFFACFIGWNAKFSGKYLVVKVFFYYFALEISICAVFAWRIIVIFNNFI